jgi:biotin operon repressor
MTVFDARETPPVALPVAADEEIDNNLIASLRTADRQLLLSLCVEQEYATDTVLYRPGDDVRWVYFPRRASLISYVIELQDGRSVETALIGREGAVGGIVSQGRLPAYSCAVVQYGGPFYRVESASLEEAKRRSLSLRHLFARYADCLMAQIFQSVACNAAHTIEQRFAKWSLAVLDRTGGNEIALTQEHLASMLGIGRSYFSRVVKHLKEQGVIRSSRGKIIVESPERLEGLACDCNHSVRAHFEDVLKGVYPTEDDG